MISTRLCSFMAYTTLHVCMYVVATATRSLYLRLLECAVGGISSTRGIAFSESIYPKPCGCPATDRQRVLGFQAPGTAVRAPNGHGWQDRQDRQDRLPVVPGCGYSDTAQRLKSVRCSIHTSWDLSIIFEVRRRNALTFFLTDADNLPTLLGVWMLQS